MLTDMINRISIIKFQNHVAVVVWLVCRKIFQSLFCDKSNIFLLLI